MVSPVVCPVRTLGLSRDPTEAGWGGPTGGTVGKFEEEKKFSLLKVSKSLIIIFDCVRLGRKGTMKCVRDER